MKGLFSEALRKTLHTGEKPFDVIKLRVKRRFNLYGDVKIQPYRGFGNGQRRHILGRVLEDRDVGTGSHDDPWWKNAADMLRRFHTDEVPRCAVRATLFGQSCDTQTDNEGYFRIEFESAAPPSTDKLWHDVELELGESVTDQDRVAATGQLLIPPEDAEFAVVSDVDDTVLQSAATEAWRLAKLTFLNNAHTRTPFPKVAAFYRALQRGSDTRAAPNPVFYVSSSAWNIYDLFDDFMRVNDIPAGPILMRDLGIDSSKLVKSGHRHKFEKIAEIARYYPDLPLVLIGDSGQRDPWLYRDVAREFPGRVAAIYIREVADRRRKQIEQIAGELRSEGVEMLLMEDAYAAAEHAAEKGMIAEEALAEIKASE